MVRRLMLVAVVASLALPAPVIEATGEPPRPGPAAGTVELAADARPIGTPDSTAIASACTPACPTGPTGTQASAPTVTVDSVTPPTSPPAPARSWSATVAPGEAW